MTAITGVSATSSVINNSSAPSLALLQAQLDQCNKQLGDTVSCSSCKTPEGQKTVQKLEEKIGIIKAKIQAATIAKKSTTQDPSATTQSKADEPNQVSAFSSRQLSGIGSRLNIYA